MQSGRKNEQVEQLITGTILLNPDVFYDVCDIIAPEMFSPGIYQIIAVEIFNEINQNKKIDLQVFAYKMGKKYESESISYKSLLELTKRGDSNSVLSMCEFLRDEYLNRKEIELSTKTIQKIKEGGKSTDVLHEIEKEREEIYSIAERKTNDRLTTLNNIYDNVCKAKNNPGTLTGIDTGHRELNEITNGWQATDLIVLAGRPGMGKSTKGFEYAISAAESGNPAVIFSLEMSVSQVYQKIISIKTEISVERIRSGKVDDNELDKIQSETQRLYTLPIFVEDRYFNIDKIRNRLRVLKRKEGIKLCVVDYIQIAEAVTGKSDTEQVSEISRKLKQMAGNGDCNVTMIAISQLSRAVETRGGSKRPQLSDLRQSGQIEQDADIVQFVYRPEYYKITEFDDGESTANKAELIIEKNRNGRLDTILVGFRGRFFDLESEHSTSFPIGIIKPNGVHDDIPF